MISRLQKVFAKQIYKSPSKSGIFFHESLGSRWQHRWFRSCIQRGVSRLSLSKERDTMQLRGYVNDQYGASMKTAQSQLQLNQAPDFCIFMSNRNSCAEARNTSFYLSPDIFLIELRELGGEKSAWQASFLPPSSPQFFKLKVQGELPESQ